MQGEEIFETIPNKHDSVKEAVEEAKKTRKVNAQNSHEILLPPTTHLFFHPKSFPQNFSRQKELCYSCKCPAKENTRQEKRKKRRGEKVKRNSQDCFVTVKPIGTLLPAYAQTNKKAANCRKCKGLWSMFYLFTTRQWPENGSTSFKTRFSTKFPCWIG